MQKRRQVQHTSSLEERIAARIRTFKAVAETLPPGSKERERLEQKVKVHTDAFAQMEGWLNSVGLQRPK